MKAATTINSRVVQLAVGVTSVLILACTASAGVPTATTAPVPSQATPLLAGTRDTAAAPSPGGAMGKWAFDSDLVGGLPSGAQAFSGEWAVRAESDAPSPPNALCQTGSAEFPAVSLDT